MPFPFEVLTADGDVVEKQGVKTQTVAGGRPDNYVVDVDGKVYSRHPDNPQQWVETNFEPLDEAAPEAPVSHEPQGTAVNGDDMRPGEGVAPSAAEGVADAVARGEIVGHPDAASEDVAEVEKTAKAAQPKQASKKAPASKKADA